MKPTLEEVKKVAIDNGAYFVGSECSFIIETALQAFAEHWMKVGEQKQFQTDVATCSDCYHNDRPSLQVIRNNTGE